MKIENNGSITFYFEKIFVFALSKIIPCFTRNIIRRCMGMIRFNFQYPKFKIKSYFINRVSSPYFGPNSKGGKQNFRKGKIGHSRGVGGAGAKDLGIKNCFSSIETKKYIRVTYS